MQTKVCSRCKKELPATREYFQINRMGRYGLQSQCKRCRQTIAEENYEREAERKRKWYEKNKDRLRKEAKEKYWNDKSYREKKLKQNLRWRKLNPDKYKLSRAEHYLKNRDEIRARSKARYEEKKEEILNQMAEYRDQNRDRIRAYFRDYRQSPENKEKIRLWKSIAKMRRRTREAGLPIELTLEQWEECLNYFEHSCAYCGRKDDTLHKEHFIPVIKGGEFTVNNIIPSCGPCNSSKHIKDFFDWYPEQHFYSKERERKILKYLNYESNKTQQLALL